MENEALARIATWVEGHCGQINLDATCSLQRSIKVITFNTVNEYSSFPINVRVLRMMKLIILNGEL